MNKRAIIVAVTIFVLIVLGMFIFAYLKSTDVGTPVPEPIAEEDTEENGFPITRVDAKHFYRDGTHTLAGEITMPTPCDLLTANAAIIESDPRQAVVSFDVINNSEGLCAQVLTVQRFKVSFDAEADIAIEGRFAGEPITLNLIDAGEDEDPDDFELFIKG